MGLGQACRCNSKPIPKKLGEPVLSLGKRDAVGIGKRGPIVGLLVRLNEMPYRALEFTALGDRFSSSVFGARREARSGKEHNLAASHLGTQALYSEIPSLHESKVAR